MDNCEGARPPAVNSMHLNTDPLLPLLTLGRACLLTGSMLAASLPASAEKWMEVDKLLASDGVELAVFGYAIAMDRDTAIVGALGDRGDGGEAGDRRGAAYIYTRDMVGNWIEQAKLVPSLSGSDHQFGYSVDIDGDTAIVGIFEEDVNPVEDSAYIFTRDASGIWSEQAVLRASDGIFGDGFSASVAIDGDTAFVGTRPETFTGFVDLPGAVYVFTRDASGNWTEQAKLFASDGAIGDTFGRNLDLNGDIAIIGRHTNDKDGTGTVRASAYIFTRDVFGNWTEQTKILASKRTEFVGEFGPTRPVAIKGATAVISAGEGEDGKGLVFVYQQTSGVWSVQAELSNSDGVNDDGFGSSLELWGDTVVIGAPQHPGGAGNRSGAAYAFTRNTSGQWEETKLLPSDGASGDGFGQSVAFNQNTVIVGAHLDDDNGFLSGSAYVFQRDSIEVDIDIRPGNKRNNFNPRSNGRIWVAVLSDADTPFDPLQIKIPSVRFGQDEAKVVRHRVRDINKDGLADLLLHFKIRRTGIECGDTEAVLSGVTFDKQKFRGVDSVKTVGCK